MRMRIAVEWYCWCDTMQVEPPQSNAKTLSPLPLAPVINAYMVHIRVCSLPHPRFIKMHHVSCHIFHKSLLNSMPFLEGVSTSISVRFLYFCDIFLDNFWKILCFFVTKNEEPLTAMFQCAIAVPSNNIEGCIHIIASTYSIALTTN